MRVALLSGNAPRLTAVGNQIAEKVRFFQERGAEIRVIVQDARRLHDELQACTVELAEPMASGSTWDYLRQADLVIVVYAQYFELLQLLPALGESGPRIVFDYLGVTPLKFWHIPLSEHLRDSARQRGYVWFADHALTMSDASARELHEATAYPRERVTTAPLPVDSERFSPSLGETFLKQRLGLAGRVILFVGRLAGNKRVPLLVDALARMNDALLHLVVIGDCSDVYAEEMARCRALAEQLGVGRHVHFLGQLGDADLSRAYQSSDVLVMPSVHEGFCVPVIEAMASGLPVIASRSSALPETVGAAGLTFLPDDVDDLVRQLRRVLPVKTATLHPKGCDRRRVAVVSCRFGPEIIGGAESSLRTMARALQDAGHYVEVFSTCASGGSEWKNDLPAGNVTLDGLCVHRFPIDPYDAEAHNDACSSLPLGQGDLRREAEERFLATSLHSSALLAALKSRQHEFDAMMVGPYLFGLTADIASSFPDKTLLVPCFHDEPEAWLSAWPRLFGNAGGVLYHSLEEQYFAQTRLGVNHPNSHLVGTLTRVNPEPLAGAQARTALPLGKPYILYSGRYCTEKNLPLLLEWARQYQAEHPNRVDFVFIGEGAVKLPIEPWLHDLGCVDEVAKRALMANAGALVQLSTKESLSLVVLEAWAENAPVIVHRDCAVLRGQIERSNAGLAVVDYGTFEAAVERFCFDADSRREFGDRGRDYVKAHYGSAKKFVATLLNAVDALAVPIEEQMRQRGLERARELSRPAWQQRFAEFIENVLSQPARLARTEVVIEPLRATFQAEAGTRTMLLPVRLRLAGNGAATPKGPGCTRISYKIDADGSSSDKVTRVELNLPGLLTPGQALAAALPIELPRDAGAYRLVLWAEGPFGQCGPTVEIGLVLSRDKPGVSDSGAAELIESVKKTLPKAHQWQQLPTGYIDVTEGAFASVKRGIKEKLLHNFKHAYVDVLSRQQSQFNQHLVVMIQQLAECCAMLDQTIGGLHQRLDAMEARFEDLDATESESQNDAKLEPATDETQPGQAATRRPRISEPRMKHR